MKEILKNYDVFYFMMAVAVVFLLLKGIGVLLFRKLLRESGQMATTGNRWMKSMMAKFEAYYKLRISVHNVENFVEHYLYSYRFLGISLESWANAGWYGLAAVTGTGVLAALGGLYYGLSDQWFLLLGMTGAGLFCIYGAAELFLHSQRHSRMLRVQLVDYMENTMRAKLENEYLHEEESRQYQMEYFRAEDEKPAKKHPEIKEQPEKELPEQDAAAAAEQGQRGIRQNSREMKELLVSLLEEMQLEKEIQKKEKQLSEYDNTSERARLFEEVLKEYL